MSSDNESQLSGPGTSSPPSPANPGPLPPPLRDGQQSIPNMPRYIIDTARLRHIQGLVNPPELDSWFESNGSTRLQSNGIDNDIDNENTNDINYENNNENTNGINYQNNNENTNDINYQNTNDINTENTHPDNTLYNTLNAIKPATTTAPRLNLNQAQIFSLSKQLKQRLTQLRTCSHKISKLSPKPPVVSKSSSSSPNLGNCFYQPPSLESPHSLKHPLISAKRFEAVIRRVNRRLRPRPTSLASDPCSKSCLHSDQSDPLYSDSSLSFSSSSSSSSDSDSDSDLDFSTSKHSISDFNSSFASNMTSHNDSAILKSLNPPSQEMNNHEISAIQGLMMMNRKL